MFGHKAFSLLEELERSDHGIPPYRDALVREVCDEVNELCSRTNPDDASKPDGDGVRKVLCTYAFGLEDLTLFSQIAFSVMQSAIFRNRQCLLAYVNRRNHMLMQMRWNLGAVIPEDTRYCLNLCSPVVLCRQIPAFLLFYLPFAPQTEARPSRVHVFFRIRQHVV